MDTISLLAILFTIAAFFSLLNHNTLRLPPTIGVLVLSLISSIALMLLDPLIPAYSLQALPRTVLGALNLPQTLLNGMLSLLLFAGAMQVNMADFKARLLSITALSVLGTTLSVLVLASAVWALLPLTGEHLPFLWCILLGAILAPTDPVSVIGMLKRLGLPGDLQALFAGESLFNDGVAVVLFTVVLTLATGNSDVLSASHIGFTFLHEAIGGIVTGIICGTIALFCIRKTDDPHIHLLTSLALATGSFSIANSLEFSSAIAAVTGGLTFGTRFGRQSLPPEHRAELESTWMLLDEILNILLFMMVGLEIIEVKVHSGIFLSLLLVIPLSLISRGASVLLATLPNYITNWDKGRSLKLLTWGGLRGGISVALALGLPPGPMRDSLLPLCYGVVVFSIIVQGLTMERVARNLYPTAEPG
ncbi:Na+/H+ antiporter [Neokomagataea thailandica NBRC 106555]|uniref:Sodium:proton antiporter n=2 Tax=Neokomagataea TaxID=1223423 RepID=A0A4Y6V8X2_9PROT|nr:MULTISPECIES: sodium:proton antiporter [Neokomagataea]QDH25061.1 sodium:proton antiporter [Neokomagataea tanensis]GBR54026.1 Na+/H+ antiporter [Neokomagataea thailandica NBRC 106555]